MNFNANPRLSDYNKRAQHYNELYGMVADILQTRTTAEWIAFFEGCDIPCAPMHDLDALIDDPHLDAVGFFQMQTHPTEGRRALYRNSQPLERRRAADHPARARVWASTA